MNTSIFKEDMITMLNKNLAKKPKIIEDNSIQQFSDAISDKDIEEYIKRGEKSDNIKNKKIRGGKGDRI